MEYISKLFSCCAKGGEPASVKISVTSTCCDSKSHNIMLSNEDDIRKLVAILDELKQQERDSQKSLKKK